MKMKRMNFDGKDAEVAGDCRAGLKVDDCCWFLCHKFNYLIKPSDGIQLENMQVV